MNSIGVEKDISRSEIGNGGQYHERGIRSSRKYHLATVFLISLFCIICYSNTLDGPFVFDDTIHIENNPDIRLTELDLSKLYYVAFGGRSPYRPLAKVSFALNYYIGEYDPTGYHILNLIVHVISGILVYFLALTTFRLFFSIRIEQANQPLPSSIPQSLNLSIRLMSLFAALIFTVHPLQTQSVTYIIQRMNSMAAMFYLLSLLLYVHGRLAKMGRRRLVLFSTSFLTWGIALGSKQTAATLPFVIFLYEWYFFQSLSVAWLRRNAKYVLVPVALLLLLAFIYFGTDPFETFTAMYATHDFTLWERVLTQFRVLILYISLLFYPHPSRLNLLHHFTTSHSLVDPMTTLLSLLTIVGLMGLGVCLAKKQPLVSFCIFWFFVNLAIESSFLGLALVFEHRLYLPLLGFALVVPHVTFKLLSEEGLLALIASLAIVGLLGTATYVRNRTWQDEITLWSDVVSKNPQNPQARDILGALLGEQGRVEEAMAHFLEALRIDPDYSSAHNNLASALLDQGRVNEAVSHLSTALQIDPESAQAHYNMGRALLRQGGSDDAIFHFAHALKLKPDFVDAYNELGNTLVRLGRLDDAADLYLEAMRIQPDDVKAHGNIAVVRMGQGRLDEAISHFSKALEIKPDDAKTHSNLGVVLVRMGRLQEAVSHFSEALRIDPEDEDARYNLEFSTKLLGKSTGPSHSVENP